MATPPPPGAAPNALIHESSPYLRQHAYNPVQWQPWGPAALAQARQQNRLLLVSVGYSACHWCHVMERECFARPEIAAVMNAHFICIKVDREERPDVDQVYMDAVQVMRGQGGWPLNVFCLPDGRPIYGGTYFPPPQWVHVLNELAQLYATDPAKAEDYAQNLTQALHQLEEQAPAPPDELPPPTTQDIVKLYVHQLQRWDRQWGGYQRAPKFPVPGNWFFLLHYAHHSKDAEAWAHLRLTLDRMAQGGMYDQLGGGWARYSTDAQWRVPHFEKMLYDNAQLVALYSQAFRATGHEPYRQRVEHTLHWLRQELTHPQGACYSALDADSEGMEGRFYVWRYEEIEQALAQAGLSEHLPWLTAWYHLAPEGNWEHGWNVLFHTQDLAQEAQQQGLPLPELEQRLQQMHDALLAVRSQRPRPGLDDKILTGWNGLMTRGYVEAYWATGRTEYLQAATGIDTFVEKHLTDPRQPQRLLRTWHERTAAATIHAFLEDYAANLDALIALHQATLNPAYLHRALARLEYTLAHFSHPGGPLFFFTADEDAPLVTRKTETYDSVQPSSNASLAHSLLTLGHLADRPQYVQRARAMLEAVRPQLEKMPDAHAHWAWLALRLAFPEAQVAVVGPEAPTQALALMQGWHPQAMLLGSTADEPTLPLLAHKFRQGQTWWYVCRGGSCQLPVLTLAQALEQL